MKRKTTPDNGPLSPLEHTILNRMDQGAFLAGGWHINAKFVWYLWDGDPSSAQGANVKAQPVATIDGLRQRGLIIPNNKSTFPHAMQLSQDGKRRARYADIVREGGEWTVGHDSEQLYVSRKEPGTSYVETWIYRFVAGPYITVDHKPVQTRTLAFISGPLPVPALATSSAWKALHNDAELNDIITGRANARRITTQRLMRDQDRL